MRQWLLPAALAASMVMPSAQPAFADDEKPEGARNCVTTRHLKTTAVIDDRNVLFVMVGNRIFHNRLPRQCSGLAREGRFTYGTLAGSVCRHDTIRVLQAQSGFQGAACSLGYFYPVPEDELQSLVEGLRGPITVDRPPAAEVEEIGSDDGSDESDSGEPQ